MSLSDLADACTVLALFNIGAMALFGMPLPAATLAGVSLAAFSGAVVALIRYLEGETP